MPIFRVKTPHLRLIYCITYNSIQMNNLALKWHDIDVSFLKEKDEVMVNLTDMAKGFPKKDLRHIMNSKEMREYIQAIKRHYEAHKSKIQICSSLNEDQKSETQICLLPDNQSVVNDETRTQICLLPDNQSVTNDETKSKICHLPDSQSDANGETRTQNFILPDFQPVRVVNGGSKGEHGTWMNCSKNGL